MDPFKDYSDSLTSPIRSAQSVTPDDAADLSVLPRALYVGAAGDLHVTMAGGQEVTFAAVPAGHAAACSGRACLGDGDRRQWHSRHVVRLIGVAPDVLGHQRCAEARVVVVRHQCDVLRSVASGSPEGQTLHIPQITRAGFQHNLPVSPVR